MDVGWVLQTKHERPPTSIIRCKATVGPSIVHLTFRYMCVINLTKIGIADQKVKSVHLCNRTPVRCFVGHLLSMLHRLFHIVSMVIISYMQDSSFLHMICFITWHDILSCTHLAHYKAEECFESHFKISKIQLIKDWK